jgi:hypothetical protein
MWGNIDDEFGASTSEHNNAVISTLSKQNLNIGWFFGAISTLQISTNIKDTKSGNSNAIFMFPLVTVHHQIHGWHVVAKGSTFNGPPY